MSKRQKTLEGLSDLPENNKQNLDLPIVTAYRISSNEEARLFIQNHLSAKKSIKSIDVGYPNVGISNLIELLKQFNEINELMAGAIRQFSYSSLDMVSFFFNILKRCCNLETLDLSANNLGSRESESDAEQLNSPFVRLVPISERTTDMNLSSKLQYCIDFINNSQRLASLNLNFNGIDDLGTAEIASSCRSKSLVELSLAGNNFTSKSVKSFISILKENAAIKTLDIGYKFDAEEYKRIPILKLKNQLVHNSESELTRGEEIIQILQKNHCLVDTKIYHILVELTPLHVDIVERIVMNYIYDDQIDYYIIDSDGEYNLLGSGASPS